MWSDRVADRIVGPAVDAAAGRAARGRSGGRDRPRGAGRSGRAGRPGGTGAADQEQGRSRQHGRDPERCADRPADSARSGLDHLDAATRPGPGRGAHRVLRSGWGRRSSGPGCTLSRRSRQDRPGEHQGGGHRRVRGRAFAVGPGTAGGAVPDAGTGRGGRAVHRSGPGSAAVPHRCGAAGRGRRVHGRDPPRGCGGDQLTRVPRHGVRPGQERPGLPGGAPRGRPPVPGRTGGRADRRRPGVAGGGVDPCRPCGRSRTRCAAGRPRSAWRSTAPSPASRRTDRPPTRPRPRRCGRRRSRWSTSPGAGPTRRPDPSGRGRPVPFSIPGCTPMCAAEGGPS